MGKFLFTLFITSFLISFSAQNLSAGNFSAQSTIITIQTTGSVIYKEHFFDNPPSLVLNFAPQVLSSALKENITVNRGIVKNIHSSYYGKSGWLKSLTFILAAKTKYQITEEKGSITISVFNTPEQPVNSALKDELIIKDYMPYGWGSFERKQALESAIKFIRIKRQMLRSATDIVVNDIPFTGIEPSVLIEKRPDASVRVTAVNLTPAQMITTGAKVLFNQPVTLGNADILPPALALAYPKLPTVVAVRNFDFRPVSLGLGFVLLSAFAMRRKKDSKIKYTPAQPQPKKKSGIEELFLKEEELRKWSKYNTETKTTASKDNTQLSKEIFNFPTPPSDIAERRRFPRADIRNSRGILNRALVGSKTQPFKNIKVNDISKGGLSFQVKSKETAFKSPTIVKLYFSNSTKPVDLWVKIVWEKDEPAGEGKNVGAKFTRVPKESWDKIMESFGHRLG